MPLAFDLAPDLGYDILRHRDHALQQNKCVSQALKVSEKYFFWEILLVFLQSNGLQNSTIWLALGVAFVAAVAENVMNFSSA